MTLALRQEITDRIEAMRLDLPEHIQLAIENDYVLNPNAYSDKNLEAIKMKLFLLDGQDVDADILLSNDKLRR